MPDPALRIVEKISSIPKAEWDRLDGAHRGGRIPYNPFVSHAYLSALEESGSAVTRAGWQPRHITLTGGDGKIAAALPCYGKSHSQGEYVFDHAWADAYERAGGRYYPKFQCTVPFTPAGGPRLLVADGRTELKRQLSKALREETDRLGLSSAHVTFLQEDDLSVLESDGYLHRTDQQFHFLNKGYSSHEDFLSELSSSKRKNLRKERRSALENGISIDWLTGSDLTEDIWDQFFAFYMDTGSRKWGRPYLTREFYSLIGERMADDILLVMAKREGRYVAARSISSARMRFTAGTGAASRITPSCISRSAIIRPSTLRLHRSSTA